MERIRGGKKGGWWCLIPFFLRGRLHSPPKEGGEEGGGLLSEGATVGEKEGCLTSLVSFWGGGGFPGLREGWWLRIEKEKGGVWRGGETAFWGMGAYPILDFWQEGSSIITGGVSNLVKDFPLKGEKKGISDGGKRVHFYHHIRGVLLVGGSLF